MAEVILTEVPPGHGVISKLTGDDGDFRIPWDPNDPASVENAREAFDDLRRTGYMLYRTGGRQGSTRTQVTRFDPADGQLVAVRPNRGG